MKTGGILGSVKQSRLFEDVYLLGAVILIIITVSLKVLWIQTDDRLGPTLDEKGYIVDTIAFVDNVKVAGGASLSQNILDLSRGGRPPTYQLLSVPFILVFGRSMDAALMVNMMFQVVLILSAFMAGKTVSGSRAGFLAAFLVSVYPPLTQLLHMFRPHAAIPACVALSLWLLLRLMKTRATIGAWWFVLSVGFGTLVHPFYVMIIAIPVVFISLYILFFQAQPHKPGAIKETLPWLWGKLRDSLFWRGYLLAGLLVIGIVGGWYLYYGQRLLGLLSTVSSTEVAEFRDYDVFTKGLRDVPPGFPWYLFTLPYAISNILTLFFGIGLVSLAIKHKLVDWVLLILFAGGYICPSMLSTKTWMQFAGILPIVALITAIWIADIRTKWLFLSIVTLTVIVGTAAFSFVNFGSTQTVNNLAVLLGAPMSNSRCESADQVFCPRSPVILDFHMIEVMDEVKKDCKESSCVMVVVTMGTDFNSQVFQYHLNIERPEWQDQIQIDGISSPAFQVRYFDFRTLLESDYLVYISGKTGGGIYGRAAVDFLDNPPTSFMDAHRQLKAFPLKGGQEVKVLTRIKALTLEEAQDTISAVQLDDKYKSQQYEVLAPLYEQKGDLDRSLEYYQEAMQYAKNDKKRVQLLNGMGRVYLAQGRVDDAIAAFQESLEFYIYDLEANTALAKIFQEKNDCRSAIPYWQARVKKQQSAALYSDLGDALFRCDKIGAAIAAYKEALKFDAQDARALFGLATSYAGINKNDLAEDEFRKVIQYAPGTEYARQAQEWLDKHK